MLNKEVLVEGNITLKNTKSGSEYLKNYALSLADNSELAPTVHDEKFSVKGTNQILTGGISAGWTKKDDLTITYTKKQDNATIATITGLKGTLTTGNDNSSLDKETKVISIAAANLAGTKVTLKDNLGLGYGLSLGNDTESLISGVGESYWEKKANSTTALYKQDIGKGYSKDDAYTINYSSKTTTKTLATINGIRKDVTQAALSTAIEVGTPDETGISTLSLSSNILAEANVTLGKNDKYGFVLTDAETAGAAKTDARWLVNNGTATIVDGTTAGWAIKQTAGADTDTTDDDVYDNKTIVFTKANYTTYATVKGLAKTNLEVSSSDGTKIIYVSTDTDDDVSIEAVSFDITGGASNGGSIGITAREALIPKTPVSITLNTKAVNNGAEYAFDLEEGSSIVSASFGYEDSDNDAKWYITGTTAYLKKGESDGWTYKTDNKGNEDKTNLVYVSEKPVANSLASATITGLKSGLVVDGGGSIIQYKVSNNSYSTGITIDDTTVKIEAKEVLGTANVSIAGASSDNEYKFSVDLAESGLSIAASFSAPTWEIKGGTATLKQRTTAGFTLEEDGTLLRYTAKSKDSVNGDAVLTITGLNKTASLQAADLTTGNASGISFTYTEGGGVSSGTVFTLSNDILGGNKVSIKSTDKTKTYSLSFASDVAQGASSVTDWVASGTTLTYKSYETDYYRFASIKGGGASTYEDFDHTNVEYVKATTGTTYSTITGIKKDSKASDSAFDAKTKVFNLSSDNLDGKAIKITGDAFQLGTANIEESLSSYLAGSTKWETNGTTATFKAKRNKGYILSEDAKTLTYLASKDTKEQTIVTISNLKSGTEIADSMLTAAESGGMAIITLTDDHLVDKTVTLKGEGYKLAYGGSLSSAIEEGSLDWTVSGNTATFGGRLKEGYKLSADEKSIVYNAATGRGKSVTLTTIKGITNDALSSVVIDETEKTITLGGDLLDADAGVTVGGGEFAFTFENSYENASITGSANADVITAAGASISINAGKGNDSVTFGGKSGVFIYASGDGDDTVTGDDVTINISGVAITEQNFRVTNEGSYLVVGKGSINLGSAQSVKVYDKNKVTTTYISDNDLGFVKQEETQEEPQGENRPAPDVENALTPFLSTNYDTSPQLDSIIKPAATGYVLGDADFSPTPTPLGEQSDTVAYSGDDKK